MSAISRFVLVLANVFVTGLAAAQDGPNPSDVRIQSVSYHGTGCREGTAAVNVSPDAKALTLLFSEYDVEAGADGGQDRSRKNCNIDVRLRVPDAWTFAIEAVDYRGYVALDAGATGTQESKVSYPPTLPMTKLAQLGLTGPLNDDFHHRVNVPAPTRRVVPCGSDNRFLKLQTDIQVRAPRGARALMVMDSTDGEFHQAYRFAWRRCQN